MPLLRCRCYKARRAATRFACLRQIRPPRYADFAPPLYISDAAGCQLMPKMSFFAAMPPY